MSDIESLLTAMPVERKLWDVDRMSRAGAADEDHTTGKRQQVYLHVLTFLILLGSFLFRKPRKRGACASLTVVSIDQQPACYLPWIIFLHDTGTTSIQGCISAQVVSCNFVLSGSFC